MEGRYQLLVISLMLFWIPSQANIQAVPNNDRAGADGTWSAAGRMREARAAHTATLLNDGRVLVVGGSDDGRSASATAEVYDPETGIWNTTGPMSTGRWGHTATRLKDGRVLVCGYSLATEIYDPKTEAWSPAGDLRAGRFWHTATLLSDGRVLVAGGYGGPSRALSSVEVYDPGTGIWSNVGSMREARRNHTATLLYDGKVLVVGGINNGSMPLATAEVYDPKTGAWSPAGRMNTPRFGHTGTLLNDGRVLVVGGALLLFDGNAYCYCPEVYDPEMGAWSAIAGVRVSRRNHTATLLDDGRVLITGGGDGPEGRQPLSTTLTYDPETDAVNTAGNMSVPRLLHTATLLMDGTVLVVGGIVSSRGEGSYDITSSADLYS